ncbi:Ala-tRNA(Pro) deacylase [Pasteurella testudinis DSM 23072]|uniref:Ala-tRNA(Pro) deacylase n=1 Tax=Pasteurella testudinis DSM 23072 TaxID=1122938 RepID=A0A1W1UV20_9PAST|nr:YbaK/prolyl-tRNA synthetase associated domain-containing protein [Pasteurella testudinis]SMB84947.1 Ala-tRNA(Pro) deacylase [Pasteurella testudinis DSM 23072]SUB52884.1 Prolyl-tRNA deacylase proX [Pasteurella testudinis]
MSQRTFQQLTALLDQQQARYRTLQHRACGKSEQVAQIRGTQLGQGAKALLCVIKGAGKKQHVLAVLPADKQADLSRLATALGGTRAGLASPKEVGELTDCVFGAIPPFSFHPDLKLVAERSLFARYAELAFNAGTLENSIILNTEDYRRIANPLVLDFVQSAV